MNRLSSILAGAGLAIAAIAVTAPAANAHSDAAAASLDTLNCLTGTSRTTYDPPISQTAADTTRTIDQKYAGCLGTGAAAGVSSGVHQDSNLTHRSCLQLLSTGTVSWTINWNNGQSSAVTANRVSNVAGAVFTNTFTGTITSGLLAGHGFVETMTSPSLAITACTLGLGTVSELNSLHTLTVL